MSVETELAIIAALVAGYALLASRLDRLSIGPAFAFVVIGMLISEDVLGPISVKPETETIRVLAEVTLTLVLFADASTIRASALRRDAAPVARLLMWACCSRSRWEPLSRSRCSLGCHSESRCCWEPFLRRRTPRWAACRDQRSRTCAYPPAAERREWPQRRHRDTVRDPRVGTRDSGGHEQRRLAVRGLSRRSRSGWP